MGSLTSRPSIPKQSQVIYVPQPTPAGAPSPAAANSDSSISEKTPEENQSEERKDNLLRRGRGRFGTIRTGFLGITEDAAQPDSRKTLLGQ